MSQEELVVYKRMPVWQHDTVPGGFLKRHNTKEGTWAQLKILRGSLQFALMDENGNITAEATYDTEHQPPRIEPQAWHQIVSMSPDIQCQLDFLCRPADYFTKKYDLTAAHSEVVEAAERVPVGRALDIGCGGGRNALYLARRGFAVDAWDWNGGSLANLQHIADAEGLKDVYLAEVDLNQVESLEFDGPYHPVHRGADVPASGRHRAADDPHAAGDRSRRLQPDRQRHGQR